MGDDIVFNQHAAGFIFAKAWNLLDVSILEPYLDETSIYESQMVMTAMTGKKEIINYLKGKFITLSKKEEYKPILEIGKVYGYLPCVIIFQGSKENPVGVAMLEVEGNLIKRIDLCIVPSPYEAVRTGIFPGLIE
jgi:hypothetical protein